MSRREIERRYNKLMKDVETNEFYTKVDLTNRVNCYVCQTCKHVTKTIDIDSGVTPFMHTCFKCGNVAHSTFYTDIAPHLKPVQEWYRPTLKQCFKMKDGILEHVLKGGLDVRLIEK